MPRILTDKYRDSTFFVPYTEDKSEGCYVRPLTESMRAELRMEAGREAGADEALASSILTRMLLTKSVQDWTGFRDVSGEDIPCTPEMKREICECDPDFSSGLALRICNVARFGELQDRKN